ncbi:MAG: cell envelope integrity protein CreD [Saprospiraceae bacterium]|nr:cell envelope integrity protein CreD [Candidatus Opimibacter skivensis]
MEEYTPNEKKHWTENVLFKVVTIGFLILVLMIPSMMINELVRERSSRKMEVTNEVSSKWGQLQTITGPYIVIPYMEELKYANQPSEWREQKLYYFPQILETTGDIIPVVRKRSIFKVMLYESNINISGSFSYPDLKALKITPDKVLWDKARLHLSLTDLSGIGASVNLALGDTLIPMTAAVPDGLQLPSGLMCNLPGTIASNEKLDFQIKLSLKGSQGIYFSPVGGQNKVKLTSSWPSPKFEGQFLPDTSTITTNGFEASWTILDINRQISQQWTEGNPQTFQNVNSNRYPDTYAYDTPANAKPVFGVELLDTVDHYTKNERTVKYAFLLITLTFAVYFFCEVLKKQKVHPLQYGLVGAALVIFFILLLSLSEHIGFDPAYGVASISTILLITLYSRSIFTEKKYAMVAGSLLVALFGFIYIILQLEDYALLAGSIALFVIIALIMYLTRKVKW